MLETGRKISVKFDKYLKNHLLYYTQNMEQRKRGKSANETIVPLRIGERRWNIYKRGAVLKPCLPCRPNWVVVRATQRVRIITVINDASFQLDEKLSYYLCATSDPLYLKGEVLYISARRNSKRRYIIGPILKFDLPVLSFTF